MTGVFRQIGRTVGVVLVSSAALLGIWQLAITVLPLNSFIAKGPIDVFRYLFTVDEAADHRIELLHLLGITLGDALIGLALGVVFSTLLALSFALVPALEKMFLPVAMFLVTIPLVGFAPAIYVIFGNGAVTVAIIGSLLVFFPVLVNVALGLNSASTASRDLIAVYGGNRWHFVVKVAIPSALPSFFSAMKIAVPLAFVAAMLYEWLFSLTGLGGQIELANARANFTETWSIVVLVSAASIVVYNLIEIIEVPILAAWGPLAGTTPTRADQN
jgi:ABC-type nitrate/sulfonate/bicarbonate transport system permease component